MGGTETVIFQTGPEPKYASTTIISNLQDTGTNIATGSYF